MASALDISEKYDIPVSIVEEAFKNINNKTSYLVSVSGKIGAGKDTIAPEVMEKLNVESVHEFFARPLKVEINEVINIINISEDHKTAVDEIVKKLDVTQQMAEDTVNFIYDDVRSNPEITSYERTQGMRRALQYWGTEVRRKQDDKYWVKKAIYSILSLIAEGKSVYVTDARFVNEIDALIEVGGIAIRLNMSPEEQEKRIWERDGVHMTEEASNHPSETSLDDYGNFVLSIFTDGTTPEEVIEKTMEGIKNYV